MATGSVTRRRSPDFDRPNMRDLRIVVLGKDARVTCTVGNSTLGTQAFPSEAPAHVHQWSVRVSGEVEERHITVINAPHLLQKDLNQDQLRERVRDTVATSSPGPHAFIVTLQYKDFTEDDSSRVKQVLNLFGPRAVKRTIVLTTDEETKTSIIFFYSNINSHIHNLIKECGGKYQFDSSNRAWRAEIFRRIEEIIKEEQEEFLTGDLYQDGGVGTSVDGDLSRPGGTCDSTKLTDDGGGKGELNLVLCGNDATLKTTVSKIIRGTINKTKSKFSHQCVKKEKKIDGRQITVIELPALTGLSEQKVIRETFNCVFLCDPGVHLFIHVTPATLTAEDRAEMEKIKGVFHSVENFMVLFIFDKESEFPTSTEGQKIVKEYGSWYNVMRLNDQKNSLKTSDLLRYKDTMKIEPYTLQTYMSAGERRVRCELQQILTAREKEIKHLQEIKKPNAVKLNLVVCGSDRRAKRSISNLILNQSETGSECVRRDVDLHGRLISLVELPALFLPRLSEEEVMHQALHCVSLCDPGVHLFLFIIPHGAPTNEDKAEVNKIQKIFSSRINKHIMILIMKNSDDQTEELHEETQAVIQSFGGRHHFICPNPQVSRLMENIKQMVEGNRRVCFTTETLWDAQLEKLQKLNEMEKKINSLQTWFQTQDSKKSTDDLRIVLLGKTGVGKSSTGNTILGRVTFKAVTSQESVTKESKKEMEELNGRCITVIDTPGLFDTELSNEEIQREIGNCISMILPGPHAFILVLSLGQRFTKEEESSVEIIQKTFGENSLMFTMVLFTRGDELKNQTIEKSMGKPGSPLMKLIEACGNRFHVFNNNQTADRSQVTGLLEKIDDMVKANGDSYYSCKMFRELERHLQDQQMKILEDNVEQLKRDKEELKIKHGIEVENERQDHQREKKRREEEFIQREERYKRDIKEREEKERKTREEMNKELEYWQKQRQKERQEREEEDERRRNMETVTWNEYYEKFKRERERRQQEREDLQSKHKDEMKKVKKMMKKERKNHKEERKRREDEYTKRQEQRRSDSKYIEDHERKIRQEMKSNREKWENLKQQDEKKRKEEIQNLKQLFNVAPVGQHRNDDDDVQLYPECLRILLFGRKGNGKSATGNTILRRNVFHSEDRSDLVTTACQKELGEVDGKPVAVVDTPALFDTTLTKEEALEEIMKCVSLSAPGPHVIIIVLRVGRVSPEDKDILNRIKTIFGSDVAKFCIIIFTRADELKKTIEEYIKEKDELKNLSECGNRFLAFNNKETQDQSQVTELFNMIEDLKKSKKDQHFTSEMFEEAGISVEKRKEIIDEDKKKNQDHVKEISDKLNKAIKTTNKRLNNELEKIDDIRVTLENMFRREEEELRRAFEERERSEQEELEEEDQKQSDEEDQRRAEYEKTLEEMKRDNENHRSQHEKQQEQRDEEDRMREEEYKQDQDKMKHEKERIMAELQETQDQEIKHRESEERTRKAEEKERAEWMRRIKEAESVEEEEETKRKQREWEEEQRKMKEKLEKQLREKQDELENMRIKSEREREEERQRTEEEREKQREEMEEREREYEEQMNAMEKHNEQLKKERKEERERRKQEDQERRTEKRRRWEKMINNLRGELEEEIRRRTREEMDRITREERECADRKQENRQEIEKLEKKHQHEARKQSADLDDLKERKYKHVQEVNESLQKLYEKKTRCHVM